MRSTFACALIASVLAGCAAPGVSTAERGVESVNEPVMTRASFAFDAAAPGGYLPPEEIARLDGWFNTMDLGFGDSIYLDGAYAESARAQVAQLAGRYGMMVSAAAPVTAGAVPPGSVRVIVNRNRAEVPGCPNWSTASQPNWDHSMMPNYGCATNSNLAAMVASPEDLFHGRPGPAASDGVAGAKAVQMYRDWPLTAVKPGQDLRPLKPEATKGD